MIPPPPRPTLFPYTTLFRSIRRARAAHHRRSGRAWTDGGGGQPWKDTRTARQYPNSSGGESAPHDARHADDRSEEHTSELQSLTNLVCRLLLEKKKKKNKKK